MLRGMAVALVLVTAAAGLKLLLRHWAATDGDAYFLSALALAAAFSVALGRLEIAHVRGERIVRDARRSERLMRRAFEVTPTPMFILDHELSTFVAVNDAALQIFAIDRDHFLRMGLEGIKARSSDNELSELPSSLDGRSVRLVVVNRAPPAAGHSQPASGTHEDGRVQSQLG